MREWFIPFLLITAALSELMYILFREIKFTSITVPVYVTASIISIMNIVNSFGILTFISLSSILLLLISKIKFRNKTYEKPDYRYLLILTGVIIFHMK